MEIQKITQLTHEWRSASSKLIASESFNHAKMHDLLQNTYQLLDKYSTEAAVPKELCELLLEMHDFSWWVSELEDTPLHYLSQDLCFLICELHKVLLTRDADTGMIEKITSRILHKQTGGI